MTERDLNADRLDRNLAGLSFVFTFEMPKGFTDKAAVRVIVRCPKCRERVAMALEASEVPGLEPPSWEIETSETPVITVRCSRGYDGSKEFPVIEHQDKQRRIREQIYWTVLRCTPRYWNFAPMSCRCTAKVRWLDVSHVRR